MYFFLGAKLSCTKLSIFLSWYQIVRLPSWAKLSVFTILVPNCLGAKLSHHLVSYPTRWSFSFILGPLHWSSIFLTSRGKRNIVQLCTNTGPKQVLITWHIMFPRDLVDENAWMLGTKFYANQQRERGGANLTACILGKLPECVYKVFCWELF